VSREELPKALATWYDYTKWMLDRVDGFPKNQRFVLGTRLADGVVDVMELLAEAAYARGLAKADLLDRANRRIESVRWLVRGRSSRSPLDFEADGVPRQSLIKVLIAERLATSRHKVGQFGAGNA